MYGKLCVNRISIENGCIGEERRGEEREEKEQGVGHQNREERRGQGSSLIDDPL